MAVMARECQGNDDGVAQKRTVLVVVGVLLTAIFAVVIGLAMVSLWLLHVVFVASIVFVLFMVLLAR